MTNAELKGTAGSGLYFVAALRKSEAIEKAKGLAANEGHLVTGADAARFNGRPDYAVDWKVRVYWDDGLPDPVRTRP